MHTNSLTQENKENIDPSMIKSLKNKPFKSFTNQFKDSNLNPTTSIFFVGKQKQQQPQQSLETTPSKRIPLLDITFQMNQQLQQQQQQQQLHLAQETQIQNELKQRERNTIENIKSRKALLMR